MEKHRGNALLILWDKFWTFVDPTLTSLSAPAEASRHVDPILLKSTLKIGSFPCQAISGVSNLMSERYKEGN